MSNLINECPKFLNGLSLKLTSTSDISGCFELRKPRIVDCIFGLKHLYGFEEDVAKHIKVLKIIYKSCDYNKLKKFLCLCKNLKELSMEYSNSTNKNDTNDDGEDDHINYFIK